MIVAFILACEALFWVLLLAGLAARYLLRSRRLSTVLLLLVPVLDVVLLAAISLHLASGADAEAGHGLGALYLGFTVAWGHPLIRWADARFAHRFAGGPPPPKPPKAGLAGVRHEAVAWLRTTAGCAIGAAVLGGLIWLAGDPERTQVLSGYFATLGIVMFWNTVIGVWGAVAALTAKDRGDGSDGESSGGGAPSPHAAVSAPAPGGAPAQGAPPSPVRAPATPQGASKAVPKAAARGTSSSSWDLWLGAVLCVIGGLPLGYHYIGALIEGVAPGSSPPHSLIQLAAGVGLVSWHLLRRFR
ncbi:hypothetical protein [Nocardiopsis suaedae]|uniref:RDD domain-containing protein n=1 Tax=Nocardiopsis suaedae TaxID=3018444 RepID=A0ABT4TUT1_9ACTN|nr:hypothetical protein [Nocardiopsis suaedae]MDA2808463.1 hypothetical protein [Nocardiopsis suaedae]